MEVYPKGVQPIRVNHSGLVPISEKLMKKKKTKKYECVDKRLKWQLGLVIRCKPFSGNVNDTGLVMTSRIWHIDLRAASNFV